MEEPTCVIHSFSYTSGISNEAKEENPMYALGESVSFGRFTSESLSWEKWSTFNRNRYVEEAEKYSRPGSVKQKKAYLEAHFKRMAAVKADQANANQEAPDDTNVQGEAHDDGNVSTTTNHGNILSSEPGITDQQWVDKEAKNPGFGVDKDEDNLKDEIQLRSIKIVESDQAAEIKQTGYLIDAEKQSSVTEMESGLTKTQECCLQGSNTSPGILSPAFMKRNPPLSSYIPSVGAEASLISSSSPAKSVAQPPEVHLGKENVGTLIDRKSWMDDLDKKRTPLCTSISRELSRLISPVIKKTGGSFKASRKHRSTALKNAAKEKPKAFTKFCQSFCFQVKLPSTSFKEKER